TDTLASPHAHIGHDNAQNGQTQGVVRRYRRAGRNRGLRSSAAETSETSTPTGKISTKVMGMRNIGSAYWTFRASMSAASLARAASVAPSARACSSMAFE